MEVLIVIFFTQERLKKLKKERGNVELGNITVDMVRFFRLCIEFLIFLSCHLFIGCQCHN